MNEKLIEVLKEIEQELDTAEASRENEIKLYADEVEKANNDLLEANNAYKQAEKVLNIDAMDIAQEDKENAQKRIRLYQEKINEFEVKSVISYGSHQGYVRKIKGLLESIIDADRERLIEIGEELDAMKEEELKYIVKSNELIRKSYSKSSNKGERIIGGGNDDVYSTPLQYTLNTIKNTIDVMKTNHK